MPMPFCPQCESEYTVILGSCLRGEDGSSVSRIIVDCQCFHKSVPIDEFNIDKILAVIGVPIGKEKIHAKA